MSEKISGKMVVVALAFTILLAGYARADKVQLQEKLSKTVQIQLSDVTIAEAIERIGEKSGVEFVLSDEAAWKLPHGRATRLSVALDGPLTEAMTEMLNVFFMRYAVGDEQITIYPRPELDHILGRPNTRQLELLKAMYRGMGSRLALTKGAAESIGGRKLVNLILGQEVVIMPISRYRDLEGYLKFLEPRIPEGKSDEFSMSITLAQVLNSLGRAWYVAGMDFPDQVPEIHIVKEEDFRQARLDQIVDISFKDKEAQTILQTLAKWVGMQLIVEKKQTSWLSDHIDVDMQNITLRQAIRNIITSVGGDIRFNIGDNEIGIAGPKHPQKGASSRRTARPSTRRKPTPSRTEGYAGKISIPMDGGKYFIEFMLREDDLTEELRKMREEKMKEFIGEPPKPKPSTSRSRTKSRGTKTPATER